MAVCGSLKPVYGFKKAGLAQEEKRGEDVGDSKTTELRGPETLICCDSQMQTVTWPAVESLQICSNRRTAEGTWRKTSKCSGRCCGLVYGQSNAAAVTQLGAGEDKVVRFCVWKKPPRQRRSQELDGADCDWWMRRDDARG